MEVSRLTDASLGAKGDKRAKLYNLIRDFNPNLNLNSPEKVDQKREGEEEVN